MDGKGFKAREHALSVLRMHTKNAVNDIATIFRLPLLLAMFAVNCLVVLPLGFLAIWLYGASGIAICVIMQTPVMYLIVREARRQLHSLPMSESWELSPEDWDNAIEDYVKENSKD